MTRVDFYVLATGGQAEKLRLACRLAQKAYRAGHRVYIHAADEAQATRLDELLWTFAQDSFVPHRLYRPDGAGPNDDPVGIGFAEPPECFDNVLIALGSAVPEFFGRFERLLDLVADEPSDREQGRERFRFYRDRGYPMETHNV